MLDPWPFATVPDRGRSRLWAGRQDQLEQLNGLLSRWGRRKASEICVIWADFGQGKTHSLMHLQSRLAEEEKSMSHYAQLPPLTGGSPFVALYRQVMRDFPLEDIARRVFRYFERSPMAIFREGRSSDRLIHQLLWIIATRAPGSDVAGRWLRGEPVGASDLGQLQIGGHNLGLTASLKTAADCQAALDSIVSVCTSFPAGESYDIVFLLDEFQRIGELTRPRKIEVCDAIHLLFNSHPQNLRLVLAFAGGVPEIVNQVLTPDLQRRVQTRLDYAPLTRTEGVEYVGDLLAKYNTSPSDRFAPYERDAVEYLVQQADGGTGMLSPRAINIVFDNVTNAVLDSRSWGRDGVEEDVITLGEVRSIVSSKPYLAVVN